MTAQEAIKYIEQHNHIDDIVKDMCIEALRKQDAMQRVIERLEEEIAENPDASLGNYRAGLYKAIEIIKEEVG